MRPVSIAFASCLLLLTPGLCNALSLGNASTRSRIGGPLRVEIPIQLSDEEKPELSCIRVAPPPADYVDEVPWLAGGKLQVEQRGDSSVLVASFAQNNHPAVRLGIQLVCNVRLRRDYTLLLDPPNESEGGIVEARPPVRQTTSVNLAQGSRRDVEPMAGREWITAPGETPASIAQTLLPRNLAAQRRFAKALLAANAERPGMPAGVKERFEPGSQIVIPKLDAARTGKDEGGNQASELSSTPTTAPRVTPGPRIPQAKSKDRLLVRDSGGDGLQLSTTLAKRPQLSTQERERLRSELQLTAILDEKIARQVELTERIRQLEALQQKLQADADRLDAQLREQSRTLAQKVAETSQPPVSIQRQSAVARDDATGASWLGSWISPPALALAGTLFASILGLLLWGRRSRADETEAENIAQEISAPSQAPKEALIEPLSRADIWPEKETQRIPSNPPALRGAIESFSGAPEGPMSMLQLGDDDKEHDSAVELAEIMMSFGRVRGAAQTLAEYIRSKPHQAVEPWIKLLEVYRAADMRVEFDALTAQLNKTFNVKPPSWDGFEVALAAPESLEGYPHIMETVLGSWGKRECQTYLHTLLRDNRQGTRQGFPLAVVDEILLLISMLDYTLPQDKGTGTTSTENSPDPARIGKNESAAPADDKRMIAEKSPNPFGQNLMQTKADVQLSANASYVALDFNLDTEDLERSLHIDLDDLNDFDFDAMDLVAPVTEKDTPEDLAVPGQTGLSSSTKST